MLNTFFFGAGSFGFFFGALLFGLVFGAGNFGFFVGALLFGLVFLKSDLVGGLRCREFCLFDSLS